MHGTQRRQRRTRPGSAPRQRRRRQVCGATRRSGEIQPCEASGSESLTPWLDGQFLGRINKTFSSRQMKCGPFWDGVAAKGRLSTGISNRVRVPSPHVSQGKGPRNPPKKHTLKLPKDSYVSLFAYPLEFLKQLVPPWTYVSHATGCNPKEPSATYGGYEKVAHVCCPL